MTDFLVKPNKSVKEIIELTEGVPKADSEYSLEDIAIQYHNNLATEFGENDYWDEKLIDALKAVGTEVFIEDGVMKVVV